MATRQRNLEGLGTVTFQKRRGTKSMRIRVLGSQIKVTLPFWASYKQAERFVYSRQSWITKHLNEKPQFTNGSYVGKQHQLLITPSDNTRIHSTIKSGYIEVKIPHHDVIESKAMQDKLRKICEKALRIECETYITPRLNDLSLLCNMPFTSVRYKTLRSRWGSCDSKGNITFSVYLAQLPWPEIEYIIVHELAHTKYQNHGKDFWKLVEKCLPKYKDVKKQLKARQPDIILS